MTGGEIAFRWACANPGIALMLCLSLIVLTIWAKWGEAYCDNLLELDKQVKETEEILKNARKRR